jgi:hypothetical protein
MYPQSEDQTTNTNVSWQATARSLDIDRTQSRPIGFGAALENKVFTSWIYVPVGGRRLQLDEASSIEAISYHFPSGLLDLAPQLCIPNCVG